MINILIIIVVYNNRIENINAFNSLNKSMINCSNNTFLKNITYYFYDNSLNPQIIEKNNNYIYIHDKLNSGVSYAYNCGFEFAKTNNFQWVMLSDQDTIYPVNYFDKILYNIENHKSLIYAPILKENSHFISPVKFKYFRGIPLHFELFSGIVKFDKRIWPLNSGLILKNDIFNIFNYDKEAKLDFSDFIFINKIRNHIEYYYLMDVIVQHSLSSNEKLPITKVLNRFNFYILGLKRYCIHTKTLLFGFFFLILRATYLNLKYHTIRFYYNIDEYFK